MRSEFSPAGQPELDMAGAASEPGFDLNSAVGRLVSVPPLAVQHFLISVQSIVERRLESLIDEVHQNDQIGQSHSQMKTLPAQRFRRAPTRKQDDERRTLLSIVRQTMNSAMGIKKDADIIKVSLPDEEVVSAYEEDGAGAAEQPALNPMRPDLQNPSSCWNARLWDLVANDILKLYDVDDATLMEMKQAFHKRLGRLALRRKQLVVEETGSADDSEAEERAQLKREKEMLNKHRQRAGTRRRSVSFIFATSESNH